MTTLYFEGTVDIDPVYGRKLDHLKVICKEYGCDITQNACCTIQDDSLEDLAYSLGNLIEELQLNDYHVYRYKIKDTIVDSNLLDKDGLIRTAKLIIDNRKR